MRARGGGVVGVHGCELLALGLCLGDQAFSAPHGAQSGAANDKQKSEAARLAGLGRQMKEVLAVMESSIMDKAN